LPTGVGEITYLTAAHGDTWQLAGEQATVSSVLELLDGAGMAHIAAHGVSEPQNVHFSRLELVDGPLYAHALTGLDHYPRHVVLTASELPARKPRPTEDPFGFASVLLAGGTRTVTASASRLGAEAYAVAMADYHRRLAAGASPAVALAATIAVDPLRRPFICIGSGQA
jgi:CHAT domain-containing protein